MKKSTKIIVGVSITLLILIGIVLGIAMNKKENKTGIKSGEFKVVTSFYPIYLATLNITEGANQVEVTNMAEMNGGCIHDYTLNTQDLVKLQGANVFIENGLEMENFTDKILQTYNQIEIIDSSRNLTNLIKNEQETNGHVWTSIENYSSQVSTIADRLSEINPQNEEVYQRNKENYVKKLEELKKQYETELSKLKGKQAISLNESFNYLAREVGMEVTVIETDHEESTLSAETIHTLVDKMKQEQIQIILIDENDNTKNAELLAKETGAKIYKLNSIMSGTFNKDQYIDNMKNNLEVLKQIP